MLSLRRSLVEWDWDWPSHGMIVERHGGQLVASSGQEGGALFQMILLIASPTDSQRSLAAQE